MLTAWQHVQDNCLNVRNNLGLALFSPNLYFLVKITIVPEVDVGVLEDKDNADSWHYDQNNWLNGKSNFCKHLSLQMDIFLSR